MKVNYDDRKILQQAEVELTKAFVEFCYYNNLRYFIMGGTLLGAVRHHGFIPWDDDMDVGMPRKDYERMQEILAQEGNAIKHFPFVTYKNSDTIEYVARLENPDVQIIDRSAATPVQRNSWIDIFPLDGMPNNARLRKLHGLNLLRIRMMLKYSEFDQVSVNLTERQLTERVLIKVGKILQPEKFLSTGKSLNKLDKALKKFDYDKCDYMVNFMGAYKLKEMFPKSDYGEGRLYTFGDMKLNGPENYDAILTQMYGANYMEPPSEQIKNKHFTEVVK